MLAKEVIVSVHKPNPSTTMSEITALTPYNNEFTANLYKELRIFPATYRKNLIVSPFSLHTVLGMLGMGAVGSTRNEILDGLRIPHEQENDKIGSAYKAILQSYQDPNFIKGSSNPETFTLLTANKIYVSNQGINMNPAYASCVRKDFLADFELVDFSTEEKCKETSAKINEWVESTTNGKIKNLFGPKSFNRLTCLVLVNAIYFKGLWEYPFRAANTGKADFKLGNGQSVEVDMMRNSEKFPYGRIPELDAQAVALPYKGGRLSMVIILPNKVHGLVKIQKSLGCILQDNRSPISRQLSKSRKVDLHLPRFKIEVGIGVEKALEKLGMKRMFSAEAANFDNMTEGDGNPLFVSIILHKAFIEVNEEGTEAAAASAVRMLLGSVLPIEFKVDHPFYFQIVDHDQDDLVLFSGHCNDPTGMKIR